MSLKLPAGSRSLEKGHSLEIDNCFAEVIASFANDRAVVYGGGKGFGPGPSMLMARSSR